MTLALFGRRKRDHAADAVTTEDKWQGRQLHSSADEETCIANFLSLVDPSGGSQFVPRWAGDATKAPTTLIGVRGSAGPTYLAIWANGGYQESAGYQEMALVPPNFDHNAPLDLPGRWKRLDSSLSSIGWTKGFAVEN